MYFCANAYYIKVHLICHALGAYMECEPGFSQKNRIMRRRKNILDQGWLGTEVSKMSS